MHVWMSRTGCASKYYTFNTLLNITNSHFRHRPGRWAWHVTRTNYSDSKSHLNLTNSTHIWISRTHTFDVALGAERDAWCVRVRAIALPIEAFMRATQRIVHWWWCHDPWRPVRHDSFICVYVTRSFACICVWHGSFICVTWLLQAYDMTHAFIRATQRIVHGWWCHDQWHAVRHDSFMRVYVTHSYVRHDSFLLSDMTDS